MIENAVELAKELNINFKHLQKAWAIFILDKDKEPEEVCRTLRGLLTNDEIDFLVYVGLDAVSNSINDTLHKLSDIVQVVKSGS